MTMTKSALNGLDPLKDLLGDVLSRLEALESKVGIKGASLTKQPSKAQVTQAPLLNGKSRAKIFVTKRSRHKYSTISIFDRERIDPSLLPRWMLMKLVAFHCLLLVQTKKYAKHGEGVHVLFI